MLKKSTILFILFAFSIHLTGCQGTIIKETPVVASQPPITPIPSLKPDNPQIENMETETEAETETAPQPAKAIRLLEPKILKVTDEVLERGKLI